MCKTFVPLLYTMNFLLKPFIYGMLIHIIIEKCVFLWENSCVYIINNVGLIEYSDSIFYCSYNRTNIDNIDKKKKM